MGDRKVQYTECEIYLNDWQENAEKRNTKGISCWNREKVQYIDFRSQLGYLTSKIVKEEKRKEVIPESKESSIETKALS